MSEKKLDTGIIWNWPVSCPWDSVMIFPRLSEITETQKKKLYDEYNIEQKYMQRTGSYEKILHDEVYEEDPDFMKYRSACWNIPCLFSTLLPDMGVKASPEGVAAGMIAHTKCALLYGDNKNAFLLPKLEAKLYEIIEAFTILGFYPPVNLMWEFNSFRIDEKEPKRCLDSYKYILESWLILKKDMGIKIEGLHKDIISSASPNWKAPECVSYSNVMAIFANIFESNQDKFSEFDCKDSVKDKGKS